MSFNQNTNGSFKKVLTLTSLTFYGTGAILGAGIYSLIGPVSALVGSGLWITFMLAAICMGLTALSYCELAAIHPKAGAEYNYLQIAFPKHPRLALTIGRLMTFAGIAAAAAVTVAFSGYLQTFISLPPLLTSFALLLGLTLINMLGIEESSRVNIIFTLIEMIGLLLFIKFGFSVPKILQILSQPISGALLPGVALVIFAYFGFEEVVNLAEETKTPAKTIPLAILLSLLISSMIYTFVSLSALSISNIAAVSSSTAPLTDLVKQLSPNLGKFLGICALFSTANTVLITMLAASRSFYGILRDRRRFSPRAASAFVFAFSSCLIIVGNLETLAGLASLATLVGFSSVHISLIKLRYTQPQLPRPFFVPGRIGKLPILPLMGLCSTLLLLSQFNYHVYTLSLIALVFIILTSIKPRAQSSSV